MPVGHVRVLDSRTGESLTSQQTQTGVYSWTLKNPLYVTIIQSWDIFLPKGKGFKIQFRANHNMRKALGLHKCWITYRVWTTLKTFGLISLQNRIRDRILSYFDSVGVISCKTLALGINEFMLKSSWISSFEMYSTDVKFNLY
uniref:Replication enhancer n=3 Tax=Grapevine geminivirus A TaxID=1906317 RepID=A0A1L5YAM7_9GEMI|nr:Ren/C3 [Grapevine geminivirus A]ASJ80943.1 Ren/C3 [Grapevine geminivirus A]